MFHSMLQYSSNTGPQPPYPPPSSVLLKTGWQPSLNRHLVNSVTQMMVLTPSTRPCYLSNIKCCEPCPYFSLLSPIAYASHSSGASFGPHQRNQQMPHNRKEILAWCLHKDRAERGNSRQGFCKQGKRAWQVPKPGNPQNYKRGRGSERWTHPPGPPPLQLNSETRGLPLTPVRDG